MRLLERLPHVLYGGDYNEGDTELKPTAPARDLFTGEKHASMLTLDASGVAVLEER